MNEYSRFIVEAIKYIDNQILEINPNSIDRLRLHNTIHRSLVANVFRIMTVDPNINTERINRLYKYHLVQEMAQFMKEKSLRTEKNS